MKNNIKVRCLFGLSWIIIGNYQHASANDKPNIIFVISDQWRSQSLGFINEDPVITPNLDAFAKDAVFFKNAVTNRPICTPSRATIFTGQYPSVNGVFGNSVRLSEQSVTLGDIAKANGYQTGYVGKLHLDGKDEGYVPKERRHGFDYWLISNNHNPFYQEYFIQENKKGIRIKGSWEPDWITDKTINYIDSVKNNPFCVVLSYGPPHTGGGPGFEDRGQPGKRDEKGVQKLGYGYAAPEKWEKLYTNPEKMKRRPNVQPVGSVKDESWPVLPGYFGAITSIDYNFGRLIDYLKKNKLYENTIIVFTADHGEMLGSHGRMTKGIWYDESIGIPCLISFKDKVKSAVITNPFSTIDMTPTVLGLAGIKVPQFMNGVDFSPAMKGNSQELPDYAFCSFDQGMPSENDRAWRCVYTTRYTYVLAKEVSYKNDFIKDGMVLYDRKNDPYQLKPLYKGMGYDEVMDSLNNLLVKQLDKTNDPFLKLQWKTGNEPKYKYYDALNRMNPN